MGPTFKCPVCMKAFNSMIQQVKHQQIHCVGKASFSCPWPVCHKSFSTLKHILSHIKSHSNSTDVCGNSSFESRLNCPCTDCLNSFGNMKEVSRHLVQDHIRKNQEVKCPFPDCSSKVKFKQVPSFRTHLSQYHPQWQDFTSESGSNVTVSENATMDCDEPKIIDHPQVEMLENNVQTDSAGIESLLFDDESVVDHLARFYLMLAGKLVIPQSSVQIISEEIAFLSEILHNRMRVTLKQTLKSCGLGEQDISEVSAKVLSADILFNCHHKAAPGVSLTSQHLRKEYFKKNFNYIKPVQINIRKDPQDRSGMLQYVPIKQTLCEMLRDPTVQKQVDESFVAESAEHGVFRDYKCGKVIKDRELPPKRIDLLIFQDAFNPVNALGSAKNKYKMLNFYMTLGNLQPFLRSSLKTIRLVISVLEKAFKARPRKCLRRLFKDLQSLQDNGIVYKGASVPVYLQFVTGDNLGQHEFGGYVPAFNIEYFCRFCEYTKSMYRNDQSSDPPSFRKGKWRTQERFRRHLLKMRMRGLKDYKGIRHDCIANKLSHFHVTDPSLPVCVSHDFDLGIVSWDLAAIIKYFVVTKKWFTYDYLNVRIKTFKYLHSDLGNKPAPVHPKGKKLGGHAIQNWTLLRLLPFIIGDKIVELGDQKWKLYLLLRQICDIAHAPAVSLLQAQHLTSLFIEYMEKRKCLGRYKPKHHFATHYGELIEQFGPLWHLSTMRMEHYHQYFKFAAQTSRNCKNLPRTVALKHQLFQSFLSSGPLFHLEPKDASPCSIEDEQLKTFLSNADLSWLSQTFDSITINEIKFKRNLWLAMGPSDVKDVYVGKIEAIVEDRGDFKFVLEKHQATFIEDMGIFKISSLAQLCIESFTTLEYPVPLAVYKYNFQDCISLKHAVLRRAL